MKIGNKKILNFLYFFSLSLLLFIRDVFNININKFIFIILITVFMSLASYTNLIYMIIFTFPLLCGLPNVYILLIELLLLLIKRKKIKLNEILILVSISLVEIINILIYGNFSFITFFQHIAEIFICILIFNDRKKINITKMAQIFSNSLLIVSLIISISTLKSAPSNWIELYINGWYRFGDKHVSDSNRMMLRLNSDWLGYYCIVGIAFSIYFMFLTENKKKILYIIEISFFVLVGFLTCTRSFVVLLFLLLFIYYIYLLINMIKNSKKHKVEFLILNILIVIILSVIFLNNNLLSVLLKRFTINDNLITLGGRTDIIINGLDSWVKNPLAIIFGTGLSGYYKALHMDIIMHNAFIEILCFYGIFGLIAVIIMFFKILLKSFKKANNQFINYLPFIIIFIYIQTIPIFGVYFSLIPILISLLILI